MSDIRTQQIKTLKELIEAQGGVIASLKAQIEADETLRAWTSAARQDPAAAQRLNALAEDPDAEITLPSGYRFSTTVSGYRAVRDESSTPEGGQTAPSEPEPGRERTALHEQLDDLLEVRR